MFVMFNNVYLHHFSFWGKFGQRPNMKQTQYVSSQSEFLRLITDETKNVTSFHIIDKENIVLDYEHADDAVPDLPTGNIVIAAFTTCWARLKLYSVLEKVGTSCLYYDTDSVIFVDDGSMNVVLGDYLGQLTDELPEGQFITEFVSGGPKNYGYVTSGGEVTCKVKGFTLNYQNAQRVNFDSMKDLVLNRPHDKISMVPQYQISRNKRTAVVFNREQSKDYRVVYTKRRKINNIDTEPYGY